MSHTLNNYEKLLEEGYEHNVEIKVGQEPDFKIFKAHSIILRAQSPYFLRALSEEWRKEEDGKILFEKPNVSPKIFEFILKYIYCGDTSLDNFDYGELTEIITASDEFILPELVDRIEEILLLSTDIWLTRYFVKIFKCFSKQEFCKELGKYCNQVKTASPSIILRSEDFTLLDEDTLIEFLKLEDHGMKETEVWDRVIQWGKAQNPITFDEDENSGSWAEENFLVLKDTLAQCITYIKYSLFTSDEFSDRVKPFKRIFNPDYYEDLLWKHFINKKENDEPKKYSSVVSSIWDKTYNHDFPKIGETPIPRQIDDNSDTSVRIDSEIIGDAHLSVICRSINRVMGRGKTCDNFNLLMNSRNEGFSSQVFSRVCDEIRSTLVILTVQGTGEILGGYSPLKWGSKGQCWKQTAESFIFSFPVGRDHTNYRFSLPRDDKKAIYRNGTNGPNFGGGDLAMGQSYSLRKDAICIQTNYIRPIRNDSNYFKVESFEVFEVEFS